MQLLLPFIVTDGFDAYHMPVYSKSKHHVYSSFRDDIGNNTIEAFHKTFQSWYKNKKGFHCFTSALNMIFVLLSFYP